MTLQLSTFDPQCIAVVVNLERSSPPVAGIAMNTTVRKVILTVFLAWILAGSGLAQSTDLRPETVTAFEQYVRQAEQRMDDGLHPGKPFLLPDEWTQDRQRHAYEELRHGDMIIEQLDKIEGTTADHVPHGLIHHWAGVVFIPGTTLPQVLDLIQNYDQHQSVYSPEVLRSHLMRRQGDDFHILLRLRKHKVVTVVLDTEYDVHFGRLDAHHAYSRSHSTRVAEVEDPGGRNERDLPPGKDHGFMWALDTYWRFLEVEDGVFVQCEAISLTRDVPAGLGWLIRPFIENIPRESLEFTLATTRKAVIGRPKSVAVRKVE
jgi:hypothetical protein